MSSLFLALQELNSVLWREGLTLSIEYSRTASTEGYCATLKRNRSMVAFGVADSIADAVRIAFENRNVLLPEVKDTP